MAQHFLQERKKKNVHIIVKKKLQYLSFSTIISNFVTTIINQNLTDVKKKSIFIISPVNRSGCNSTCLF